MHDVIQTLDEVKEVYRRLFGTAPPEIDPVSYIPFPPGVDPLPFVSGEVRQLKRLTEEAPAMIRPISWMPRADTFAAKDGYVIEVEIPGVARQDLKVSVIAGEVIVRGERKAPETEGEVRPLAIERPWGSFERRFQLPPGCSAESVSARCHEGMLELRIAGEKTTTPEGTPVDVA